MNAKELKLLAEQNRKRLVEVVYRAKAGHIGGDLSCLNVMTALYFNVMQGLDPDNPKAPGRDRFVLSKGHCVEALYVTLEAKGFLKPEVLDTLGQFGSILSGHPTIEVPGIEVNSGALGHGLSIGIGMALAAKMDQRTYRTFVLMRISLSRLCIVPEDVMPIESIHERWTAFGWDVSSVNGDDMDDIVRAFDTIDYKNGKPHLLVSETTKGFGVSFMEGIAKWHHGVLNEQQCREAVEEIEKKIQQLKTEMPLS